MPPRLKYEPTHEEIQCATARIRQGWSLAQEKRRDQLQRLGKVPYTAPVYRVVTSREVRDNSPVFERIG